MAAFSNSLGVSRTGQEVILGIGGRLRGGPEAEGLGKA